MPGPATVERQPVASAAHESPTAALGAAAAGEGVKLSPEAQRALIEKLVNHQAELMKIEDEARIV